MTLTSVFCHHNAGKTLAKYSNLFPSYRNRNQNQRLGSSKVPSSGFRSSLSQFRPISRPLPIFQQPKRVQQKNPVPIIDISDNGVPKFQPRSATTSQKSSGENDSEMMKQLYSNSQFAMKSNIQPVWNPERRFNVLNTL